MAIICRRELIATYACYRRCAIAVVTRIGVGSIAALIRIACDRAVLGCAFVPVIIVIGRPSCAPDVFVEDQIAIFLIGNQDMAVSCIFCEGERCRIDRAVDSSLAVQTGAAASSIDIQFQCLTRICCSACLLYTSRCV